MLQKNWLTGLFFIAGLFVGSWQCAVACILASASGTITAKVAGFEEENIVAGLYGFSAALVGVVLTPFSLMLPGLSGRW